jgi:hypothetical protein
MKHNDNILDDSDFPDYSDDENNLVINESIDNITDCKEVKVNNDNPTLILSNLVNDESNLENDKSNIYDKFMTTSDLEQPFTTTDTSPESHLIEKFKRKQEHDHQFFSYMSELITRNKDEYNAHIQRLENENKILKQEIKDVKEKSENSNLEILKLREENQKITKEIHKIGSTYDTLRNQRGSLLDENKNLKEKNLELTRHRETQVSAVVSFIKAYQNQRVCLDSMVKSLNKNIVPNQPVPISNNESHQNENKSNFNRPKSNSYATRGDSKRLNNNNNNNNQRHKLNSYYNHNYNNKSVKDNAKSCGKNGNRSKPRSPSYSKSRSMDLDFELVDFNILNRC